MRKMLNLCSFPHAMWGEPPLYVAEMLRVFCRIFSYSPLSSFCFRLTQQTKKRPYPRAPPFSRQGERKAATVDRGLSDLRGSFFSSRETGPGGWTVMGLQAEHRSDHLSVQLHKVPVAEVGDDGVVVSFFWWKRCCWSWLWQSSISDSFAAVFLMIVGWVWTFKMYFEFGRLHEMGLNT